MDRASRQRLFEQILAQHGAAIGRVAATYERRPALRDEMLQDIAIALWQSLPGFRGDASLKTWALRVATNRSLSHVARRGPLLDELDEAAGVADPAPQPDMLADAADRAEWLARAVARLPQSLRQVMSLTLEGLDTAEVADVLGISENNVAVRLHRGRTRLRQWMGAHNDR